MQKIVVGRNTKRQGAPIEHALREILKVLPRSLTFRSWLRHDGTDACFRGEPDDILSAHRAVGYLDGRSDALGGQTIAGMLDDLAIEGSGIARLLETAGGGAQ